MAVIYKCDRCGKEMIIEKDHVSHISFQRKNINGSYEIEHSRDINFDLCEDCLADFWKWLSNRKNC